MKLGMLIGDNVLIIHVTFMFVCFCFLPSQENCDCHGDGNNEIVAKTCGSPQNPEPIQTSLMKFCI